MNSLEQKKKKSRPKRTKQKSVARIASGMHSRFFHCKLYSKHEIPNNSFHLVLLLCKIYTNSVETTWTFSLCFCFAFAVPIWFTFASAILSSSFGEYVFWYMLAAINILCAQREWFICSDINFMFQRKKHRACCNRRAIHAKCTVFVSSNERNSRCNLNGSIWTRARLWPRNRCDGF